MQRCKETRELATTYADGALDPDASRGFEAHLATCSECQTWVKQLDITVDAVRSLPPLELPAEFRDQLLSRFDAWHAARAARQAPAHSSPDPHGARRYSWEGVFAIVGVVALFIGFARDPSRAAGDWVVSLALAGGAIALAVLARRLTLRFATVAVSASFVAALIRGGPGQVSVFQGLECLLFEVAAVAAMMGAAWLVNHRSAASASFSAWVVAGALAGDAALQISCSEHTSFAHLVTFHVGGVLLISAVALMVTRKRTATS